MLTEVECAAAGRMCKTPVRIPVTLANPGNAYAETVWRQGRIRQWHQHHVVVGAPTYRE